MVNALNNTRCLNLGTPTRMVKYMEKNGSVTDSQDDAWLKMIIRSDNPNPDCFIKISNGHVTDKHFKFDPTPENISNTKWLRVNKEKFDQYIFYCTDKTMNDEQSRRFFRRITANIGGR